MKSFLTIVLLFCIVQIQAQVHDFNATVEVEAVVSNDPPSVTLTWSSFDEPTQYQVVRKDPEGAVWNNLLAVLSGTDSTFTDTTVEPGRMYEYLVLREGATRQGVGFISSGVEVAEIDPLGTLVLVVDTTTISPDNADLKAFIDILGHETYRVVPIWVDRNDNVVDVKNAIQSEYLNDPIRTQNVLLLGHVPVPYSGDIAPDAHNNHIGAWAADTYYADMNESWTDEVVDNETAAGTRNDNVPGDGKFDQSVFSSLELAVGRVDFANMDRFSESESELLVRYLRKNIAFRKADFMPLRRGIIENNFANFEEAFGQNGLRSFTPMFGRDSTSYMDFDNAKSNSYSWVYGCGGGNFQGANGISNTTNMASDSIQAVFSMLFGSYFGDWDSPNNFLRSILGSGTVLANIWAGRPCYALHQMAMGRTLGYCLRQSQNNPGGIYISQFGARGVHTGLMGDPTLRLHSVPDSEVSNLIAAKSQYGANVSWDPPTATVEGYALYYKEISEPYFTLYTGGLTNERDITMNCLETGSTYVFLVRSAIMEQTHSGTYYNLGPGVSDTILFDNPTMVTADFAFDINDIGNVVEFQNLSDLGTSTSWDFGDGTSSIDNDPVHEYETSGIYNVTLIVDGVCSSDTITREINISITSIEDRLRAYAFRISPNPAAEAIYLTGPDAQLEVFFHNAYGTLIKSLKTGANEPIPISDLHPGTYLLAIKSDKSSQHEFHFLTVVSN